MRHFTLVTILVALSTCCTDAQKASENYLIGSWELTDSSTGIKETIQFEKNDTLTFHRKDETKWKYSTRNTDSIVYLTYIIESRNATLYNEGILVILNDSCFWWFNPTVYEKYIKAIQNGYNIANKSQFETWLRSNRDVCYRLKTSKSPK